MAEQNPSERIVIGWDDLESIPDPPPPAYPQNSAPVAAAATAAQTSFASPSGVAGLPGLGPQPQPLPIAVPGSNTRFLTKLGSNTVISGLSAGAVGGLVGFLFAENIQNPATSLNATTRSGLDAQSGLYVLIFGALLGAVLMAWNGITSSSAQKALQDGAVGVVIGAVAGFLGGFVAQWLFSKMIQHILQTATSESTVKGDLILARMGGWAIFGLLLGIGIGAVGGRRKLLNGLVGGVVGAAVGGLIFQLMDNAALTTDAFWPRLVGFTLTGVGIGLAVGLVERVRRDSWVRIVSGPMAGKEFILYKASTAVGRDYRCDIVLAKDQVSAPVHATFMRDQAGAVTVVPGPGAQIAINGVPSAGARLRTNDVVTVGSSALTYQERATSPYPSGPAFTPQMGPPAGYPQSPGYPQAPGGYQQGYQ